MKKRIKSVLITFMLLATLLLVTACAEEETPYDVNDANGYTVSVKFDANGGIFTTNTEVLVDSYNISGMKTNAQGNVELALLKPSSEARKDKFTVTRNGYFLVGWYQRDESTGAYFGMWDFDNGLLEVNPNETHTASEPVVTLYAVWAPLYEIKFYNLDDPNAEEPLKTLTYDPNENKNLSIPAWDLNTGAIKMNEFPTVAGYTFENAYYDVEMTKPVADSIIHPAEINYEDGTAKNLSINVYVDLVEGEWFRISTAQQFFDNAKLDGCYNLEADLNFDGVPWPTALISGEFKGTIQGNGHTISNVTASQTNGKKMEAGLFGKLGATSKLIDVKFQNITFVIESGARTTGAAFGLLAGSANADAVISNVSVLTSKIQLDADKAWFSTQDYVIGRIFGIGELSLGLDYNEVSCEVISTKGNENKYEMLVDGNSVIVVEKDAEQLPEESENTEEPKA